MDDFYSDLLVPLIYRWAKNQDAVLSCPTSCRLGFQNENYKGIIQFHKENIVELKVTNLQDNTIVFYLHFAVRDFKSCLEHFNTFFDYVRTPVIEQEKPVLNDIKVKKILLSCTAGVTTSYFSNAMQEILNEQKMDVQVDAVSYTELVNVADEYDVILIAPQIAYMLPQFREEYGDKVINIETLDFATNNFEGVLQKIIE